MYDFLLWLFKSKFRPKNSITFFFWFNKKVYLYDFLSVNFGQREEGCRLVTSASWDFYQVSVLSFKFINSLFFFLNVLGEKKKGRRIIYIYIYIYLKVRMHHQQMHIANFIIYSGVLKEDQLNGTIILSKAL